MDETKLDTTNKYMVGVQGNSIVVLMPPRVPMSKEDALVFAAWLVALADDNHDFEIVLYKVQS